MNVKHTVELTDQERQKLLQLCRSGKPGARTMKRAQTLLMADAGALDKEISEALPTGTATIYRTKRRFVEGSVEHALSEKPRVGGARKLSGREEALLVATACSEPPTGRAKWTLVLLADEMVALTDHEEISTETFRRRLKEKV